MNLPKLQEMLLRAARLQPPSEQVPYAFEKRIMARLLRPTIVDAWAFWGRSLWRAAAACVVAMALLGSWSYQTNSSESADLAQEFENTVFAGLNAQPLLAANEDLW